MVLTGVFLGLLGLGVGSFLNVCIDRLPSERSIIRQRSHCEACQHPLAPLDLVPMLSYLWLMGRCRYCHAPITPRLPIVELTTGAAFGLLYWKLGLGTQLAFALTYAAIVIVIFFIDLEHQLVLDVVVYPAMALAVAASFFWPDLTPLRALIGGAIGLGAIGLPYLVYRQGMGMGDVKLGGFIGLMAGFPLVIVGLLLSVIAGGLFAATLLALRIKGRKDALPFAPFLASGGMVALFWGQTIADWYPPWL